jgi:hypothetical protein
MASAKQRAWRKKFAAMAKSGKFRKKSSTKRRKSTRKGQIRRTSRRAYEGLAHRLYPKRKARKSYKRRKSSSSMKLPRIPSVVKKAAIGLGAAQIAALAVGFIAPQFAGIAKPVAALAAGGVPGVAAELILDQGILSNITGMFGGGGINQTRLASGL